MVELVLNGIKVLGNLMDFALSANGLEVGEPYVLPPQTKVQTVLRTLLNTHLSPPLPDLIRIGKVECGYVSISVS